MTNLPSGREGKILAIGLLVGLLVILYLGVIGPLTALYQDRDAELTAKADEITRFAHLAAAETRLKAELAAAQGAGDVGATLLTGSSDALAAAELQSALKDIVSSAGGEFTSAESLPAEPKGEFRQIGVRALISSDLAALTQILQGVAGAQPPLYADNLDIRNSGAANPGDDDPGGGAAAPKLAVSVDVFGYRANGA